ncbi:uncharacterized protein LOC134233826, partial [Saccostrea cucullata]|uniref:uncharacterized protein LOC134233826 n=1 Tax=Saccostrea cuccullata TaxID=36930 RepID=UPI002ECFF200
FLRLNHKTCFNLIHIYYYYLDCLPGYSGVNCSQSCPYPFYGDLCQGICDCDNETCDVSTGCKIVTTGKKILKLNFRFNYCQNIKQVKVYDTEKKLGCVDLLLIFAHFFVYIHDRRNRTDMNRRLSHLQNVIPLCRVNLGSTGVRRCFPSLTLPTLRVSVLEM